MGILGVTEPRTLFLLAVLISPHLSIGPWSNTEIHKLPL
jgi:hypothetical protein